MFGSFATFIVLGYMFIYLVFGGKRSRTRSGSSRSRRMDNHRDLGELRRTYTVCDPDPENRAKMNSLFNTIKMGNFIDTSGPVNVTYMNTIINLFVDTFEFAHVYDYDYFDRGACVEKDIPFSFDLEDIVDIHVEVGNSAYMTITTRKNNDERKFLFQFVGYDGRIEARAAREKIFRLKKKVEAIKYN